MHSRENYGNQVYVNKVDKFNVIILTRIRRVILKEIRISRGAKDRAEQSNMIQTETVRSSSADHIKQSRAWAE